MLTISYTGPAEGFIHEMEKLGFQRAPGFDLTAGPAEQAEADKPEPEATTAAAEDPAPVKRGRGRPKKEPEAKEAAPLDPTVEEAEVVTDPAPKPEEEEEWTVQSVRSVLLDEVSKPGKESMTKPLLEMFGVAKLSEVPAERLGEVVKAAREWAV